MGSTLGSRSGVLPYIFLMRVIGRIGRGWLAGFAEHKKPVKSLKSFMKGKQIEEQIDLSGMSKQEEESYTNSHRLQYIQFLPTMLLAMPMFYFTTDPTSIFLLQSCDIMQYYCSGLLCFNAFFSEDNMHKYLPFLVAVGAANCLSGPISIVTPVILGAMNFYFPFTDEKMHKLESESQTDKVKSYMAVQSILYFLIVVVLTLKGYHYVSIKEMEGKLRKYQSENAVFFQKQQEKVQREQEQKQ